MFQKGEKYKRKDIHKLYGGQEQGGISTPAKHKMIFLFTTENGERYGYRDGWTNDRVFLYTGEGQEGPMRFVAGNRAIRDHETNGEGLHLFLGVGHGYVQYEGQMRCIGFQETTGPDELGNIRNIIIFQLERIS